jgi:hypothetical protein
MSENKPSQVGEASALREVNHKVNMAELQKIQDRESKGVSSAHWDEAEHFDKLTTNEQGPIAPPNIPARSELRRQQKSEDENTIEKPPSDIPLPYRPSNNLETNPPGSARQTPTASNLVQTQSDLENELRQFLAPFTKAYTNYSRPAALVAQCLQIIDDVERRVNEIEDILLQFAAQVHPSQPQFNQPNPSDSQSELQRLGEGLEQRDRRIRELDNLVAEQEDLISKKDHRFSEQVDLLNRQYDRVNEKDERIRRLEAEAVLQKNTIEKCERALQKELSRSQAPVHVYVPTGTGTSAASLASKSSTRSTCRPLSTRTGSLRSPASTSTQAPCTSDEESFLGIPLFGMILHILCMRRPH